jgi:tRNA(Arg) A34 adenosine deaminase TadA
VSGAGKGDEHWLRVSFDLARQAATRGDQAYGAVLVDASGNMLGEGRNTIVTGGDCTMHAELNLVRGLSHVPAATLSTATLYASTEPCAMCAGAIYWSGVGRLVFGLGNVRLYGEVLAGSPEALRLGCRDVFLAGKRPVAVVGPLLEDEAAGVVAAWAHGRAGR